MSTAFSWTPWASSPDLLGEREGHCATSLVTLTNSTTANSVCQPHVVVIGGYYDGELTPVPVAAEIGDASGQVGVYATVHPHKPLQWFSMTADEEVFARDGASFTSLSCLNALLFGGLNGSYERTNALHAIELFHHPSTGAVDIRATALATTGNAPTPRLRHGAGTRDGRLYIFGGETDQQEQSNELYVLDVATCVWRQIYYPSALPIPAPRLLSPSLVFITGTIFLMYGGAQFVNGEIRSLCDVWGFDTTTDSWTCVHAPNDTQFPPSNGHAGVSVGPNSSSAVFVGGKNISEGCDDFRLVHYDLETGTFLLELCPPTTDDYPHWRYTPALVAVPDGMLLLAGQCRHPQRPSCYHASLLC